MATLSEKSPSGASQPTLPQYRPRGAISSCRMRRMAAILGAPVIEPQGKSAPITSARLAWGARALTVEVRVQTVG